jgi:hypothetical protein
VASLGTTAALLLVTVAVVASVAYFHVADAQRETSQFAQQRLAAHLCEVERSKPWPCEFRESDGLYLRRKRSVVAINVGRSDSSAVGDHEFCAFGYAGLRYRACATPCFDPISSLAACVDSKNALASSSVASARYSQFFAPTTLA